MARTPESDPDVLRARKDNKMTKEQVQTGVNVRVNNPTIGARQYDPLHGHEGTIQPAYGTVVYDADIDSAWVVFDPPVVYKDGQETRQCDMCWIYINSLEMI
ncbi:MAG: hypothetical protein ACRDHW_00305 [Ktedonobacteraceae bacterium]